MTKQWAVLPECCPWAAATLGLIDRAPNQKEGVNLGLFYYHNRVAEGDPFYVTITN